MRAAAGHALLKVAVVALLVAGLAAPAEAARSCHLLKDEKGDSGVLGGDGGGGPVPGTDESSLDIVSADIATDRRNLTVVIRVAALTYPERTTPYGGMWSFHFATPEAAFFLSASRTYAGDAFHLNHYLSEYSGDTSQSFIYDEIAKATGVVDVEHSEVRITVPLSAFAAYDRISPDTVLTKLLTISWFAQSADEYPTSSEADETGGGGRAAYRAGTRNCVTVGR